VVSVVAASKEEAQTSSVAYLETKRKIKEAFSLYYDHPEQALQMLKECQKSAAELQSEELMAEVFNLKGVIHATSGDYEKGAQFMLSSLTIRERLKDFSGASRIMNNLSGVFMYIGQHEKAIEYINRAISLKHIYFQDSSDLAASYLAKGIIHKDIGQFDSAKQALLVADSLYTNSLDANALQPIALIAEMYGMEGSPAKGLDILTKAIKHFKGDTTSGRSNFKEFILAELNAALGHVEEARKYFHHSISSATQVGDQSFLARIAKHKAKFHYSLQEYDSAYQALDQHVSIENTISSEETNRRIALLEFLYEDQKKEQALLLKEVRIDNQRLVLIIVIPVAVVSLLLAIAWYYYYQKSKKALLKLSESHEQLKEANRIISRMKDSLEQQVTARTVKIKEQNLKLYTYAYLNSHKLRAPLARLMGLAYLIKQEKDSVETIKLLEYLYQAAEETDSVVKEINQSVTEEQNDFS
jgi:hypothetical protein